MGIESEIAFGVWSNPQNKEHIRDLSKFAIALFAFFTILALIMRYYGGHFSYFFYIWFFCAVLLASSILIGLFLYEFIQRPKTIEIQPSGLLLTSQWGSKRYIPWDWIKSISTYTYSNKSKEYYSQKEAKIATLDSSLKIIACLEIAEQIIFVYKSMTGLDLKILLLDI
jgi:hypothetical protein